MKKAQRQNVSGPFVINELGNGAWRLSSAVPTADIYLQSSASGTVDALRDRNITGLEIEWREQAVVVTLKRPRGTSVIEARTVIAHEQRNRLYEHLPLATFDSKAVKFWKRIFILMRLPGGRFFLKMIAQRKK